MKIVKVSNKVKPITGSGFKAQTTRKNMADIKGINKPRAKGPKYSEFFDNSPAYLNEIANPETENKMKRK